MAYRRRDRVAMRRAAAMSPTPRVSSASARCSAAAAARTPWLDAGAPSRVSRSPPGPSPAATAAAEEAATSATSPAPRPDISRSAIIMVVPAVPRPLATVDPRFKRPLRRGPAASSRFPRPGSSWPALLAARIGPSAPSAAGTTLPTVKTGNKGTSGRRAPRARLTLLTFASLGCAGDAPAGGLGGSRLPIPWRSVACNVLSAGRRPDLPHFSGGGCAGEPSAGGLGRVRFSAVTVVRGVSTCPLLCAAFCSNSRSLASGIGPVTKP